MNKTKQTNIFALLFFIAFLGSGYIVYIFPFLRNMSYIAFSSFIQIFYFIIPIIIYFIYTKKSPKEVFRLNALSFKNIILVAFFGVMIQPLLGLVSFAGSLFFPNLVEEAMDMMKDAKFLPVLFSMAIIPAFLEEFSMRGLFLSGYSRLGKVKAIFCTALLFGSLHMNPQQFFYAFLAGLFFCFLVERTNSIWASVIPHFIINATSVMSMYSPNKDIAASIALSNKEILLYSLLSTLVSLPILGLIMFLFIKINPPTLDNEVYKEERFISIPIIIIFIMFCIFGIIPFLGLV